MSSEILGNEFNPVSWARTVEQPSLAG